MTDRKTTSPDAAHPEQTGSPGTLEREASAFMELRPHLFGIAYRVLGSVTEAEDVVQEAWLRWQNTDRSVVENPQAFLARTTTRLAINVAQSARVRRETYVGPWLPEPVDTSVDPAVGAERAEALDLALLMLMEELNPVERAAYILREAFAYPYGQIADILQITQVNTRKIVSRARAHLSGRCRDRVDTADHRPLLEAFLAAAQSGDVLGLERLLADDAVSYADGNGMKGVARVPVCGRTRIAKIVSLLPHYWPDTDLRLVEVNGRMGGVLSHGGVDVVFLTCEASDAGIHRLLWVMTPEKLDSFAHSRDRLTRAL